MLCYKSADDNHLLSTSAAHSLFSYALDTLCLLHSTAACSHCFTYICTYSSLLIPHMNMNFNITYLPYIPVLCYFCAFYGTVVFYLITFSICLRVAMLFGLIYITPIHACISKSQLCTTTDDIFSR